MPEVILNIPDTAFISSALSDTNFSYSPLLFTGTDATFQNSISFLQITLPPLPVTAVDSALLQLAVIVKSGAAPSPIAVNRVTAPFSTDTVTYNTQPAFTATSSQVNITLGDVYTTVQIDVTALVNGWLSESFPNNGMALTNADGATVVQFATDSIAYEPFFPKLILNYSGAPSQNTALDFSYAQLSHVIEQIIALYPTNTVTVFTKGLTASSVTGTPYQLYSSPEGSYGSIFILLDNGQQEAIPLTAITAIYTGDGTVYDPSITYLPVPQFPAGWDTDLITAYYSYLPVSTVVDIYTGSNVHASGTIYRNEYGILVLSDDAGNTPVFTPVLNITAVLPSNQSNSLQKAVQLSVEVDGAIRGEACQDLPEGEPCQDLPEGEPLDFHEAPQESLTYAAKGYKCLIHRWRVLLKRFFPWGR